MQASFAQSPKRPRVLAPAEPCIECVRGPHGCASTPGEVGTGLCDPIMGALGRWATKAPEGYMTPANRRRPRR